MTDKSKILRTLEENPNNWFPNFKLQSVQTNFGWVGSAGGRRCRELYEAGLIERKLIGKIAHYKSKKPEIKQIYNIVGSREGKTLEI